MDDCLMWTKIVLFIQIIKLSNYQFLNLKQTSVDLDIQGNIPVPFCV